MKCRSGKSKFNIPLKGKSKDFEVDMSKMKDKKFKIKISNTGNSIWETASKKKSLSFNLTEKDLKRLLADKRKRKINKKDKLYKCKIFKRCQDDKKKKKPSQRGKLKKCEMLNKCKKKKPKQRGRLKKCKMLNNCKDKNKSKKKE